MIVILGCSDDLTRCDRIASVREGWTSAVACELAVSEVLSRQAGADYPTVAARCEPEAASRVANAGGNGAR